MYIYVNVLKCKYVDLSICTCMFVYICMNIYVCILPAAAAADGGTLAQPVVVPEIEILKSQEF
jgi:hypothetical protein